MADAGCSALENVRGLRRAAAALILLLVVLLAGLAPEAQGATSRSAAAKKALAALGTGETDTAVIVFGLRKPLRPGTRIGQAGPGAGRTAGAAATRFGKRREKRIRSAGVQFHRPDTLMRVGSEPAWFFYEDRGPHQNFEHPGRVVLVGARTGRVRTSPELRWVPLIGSRQPAFFRSAKNYESPRYRVFTRPWTTQPTTRARTRQAPPSSAQQKVADALAAEKSCAFRVSDTLGDFLDFGRVDQTRARLGLFFEGLERLNAGFVSRRYTTKDGQTPIQAAQALIDEAGCRDLFVYTAGAASRTGDAGIVIGMRTGPRGVMEWHVLTAEDLAALVDANPNVTFKFLFDAPYSARVTQRVKDRPNVLVTLAASGPNETSFLFVPEIVGPDGLIPNQGNPDDLLEFTNAIINGITSFANSDAEVDHGLANRDGISMMVWMLTRGMGMSNAWVFSAPPEDLKLPPNVTPPGGPPVPPLPGGGPPNLNPVGTTPAQPTQEDTPRAITLTATDPNDDPLTFSITDGPDHGDFTGSAPNLTYTPDQDFHGTDSFTYLVEDGRGGSNTQTVNIPVTPVNDAAAVTTASSGTPTFLEDGAPVVLDGDLTVTDADSTELEGATVAITDATRQTGDELVFADQLGITGTYDSGTGVLTLTGTASVSDYQTALRDVRFDSIQQDPTTSRTIEFRAEDGDEAGVPGERDVTITPVNDAPTLGALGDTLAYTENLGATAIDTDVTADDVDTTNLVGATVQITGGYQNGQDVLALPVQASGITGSFNTSNGTLTLSGARTPDQYETALRAVTYTNTSENPDTTTRTVSWQLDDGEASSNLSSVATRDISVAAANDAPINTVPGAQTTNEDASKSLTFSTSDADAGADDVRVTLSASQGRLTLATLSGLSFTAGDGTADTAMTFDGTIAEVNAAMTSFTYAPNADANGADTVQMITDDQGNNGPGGAQSDTDDVAMTVSAVNDAPVNTVPGGQTFDEDTTKALSGGDAISVDDVDVPAGDDLQVTLGVANGRVTVGGLSGLDFLCGTCVGDGTGDATMTFRGTKSEVNTALGGLVYEPNQHHNGSDTLQIVTSDLGQTGAGGTLTDTDTVGFTINALNDAPVNTVPGAQSTVQNTPLAVPAVSVEDVDTDPIEMTLDVDNGTLTLTPLTGLTFTTGDGSDDTTMVFSGTQAQLNAAMGGITYTPDTGFTSTDTLTVTSDDGPLTDTDTVSIDVQAANDAPINSVPGAQSVDEDDAQLVFNSLNTNVISVSDVDADPDPVRVTLDVAHGALTLDTTGLTFTAGDGTSDATMAFDGTLTQVNAALDGLTYQNTPHFNGADILTVTTNDLGNNGAGGALSDTDTVAITVNPTNDAPINVLPVAQNVTEGGTLAFSSASLNALTFTDIDAAAGTVDTELSVLHGTLSAPLPSGGSRTGNGTGTLTLSGTVTNVNTALNSLVYTPATEYYGSETLHVVTDDHGNTGSGGALTDTDDLSITVDPVNDAPTISVPSSPQTTDENQNKTLSVSVADVDGGTGDREVTLDVDNGTISLVTLTGLTFTAGDGTSDATMTFLGTLSELNAALTDFTYIPTPNTFGTDTLTASIDDKGEVGSGGDLSDSDTTTLNVAEANSAPVNSVPGTQTYDEDTDLTFSSGNGNAISVTDPDAAGDDVTTTLTATDGILDVTASTGDLTSATGDETSIVTLTGSTAEITAALEGLVHNSHNNVSGSATITVLTDDLGNNGGGGNLTDSDVINLSITAVNDGPALTEPADFTLDEGAAKVLSGADAHQVTDVDAGAGGVEVNLDVDHGTITLDGTLAGLTFDQGDGTADPTVEFSGTVADVNAALDGMSYTANSNDGSSDTLDATVSDNGNTGSGGALGDSDTVAITINALNEAPVHTVPGTQTFDEDTILAFNTGNGNAISVADGDAGGADVRTTLTSTLGTMSIDTTGIDFTCTSTPPAACAGDGTGDTTMTFEGTLSEINAALQTLTYDSNPNVNGSAQITITTNDLGNSGGGGAQSDSDNIPLTITAVNDAPENTVPGAQSVDEDTDLVFSSGNGNGLSIADVDADSNDVRVTLAVTNGVATLAGTTGLDFACAGCAGTGTQNATMTFEGTVAEVTTALATVTYRSALNYNGPAQLTLTTNDLGNAGSGGALQDSDNVAITVNPVNDAPVANNDSFGGAGFLNDQAHGNTTMQVDDTDGGGDDKSAPSEPHTEIQGDILAGDTDVDGLGPIIVQSAGSDAGATNGQTSDGGTVSIESDGDFVYRPPPSVSCDDGTDTFNYKISDQTNSGAGPIPGTAIGTVTIHLEGCVWYVDNNGTGNAGTSSRPFDTLGHAEGFSGPNDTVFVFEGDGSNTGLHGDDPNNGADSQSYQMNAGERLIGEHEGLVVDPDLARSTNTNGALTADTLKLAVADAHPSLFGVGADVIDLDDNNEIRGVEIDPGGAGGGIFGGSGDDSGTFDDIRIVDNNTKGTQPALELDGTAGTFSVSSFLVQNGDGLNTTHNDIGVRLNNAGTVAFDTAGSTLITTDGAMGLEAVGTNMGGASGSFFDAITVTNSGSGGVRLSGITGGTTHLGDNQGAVDLSLTTTTGTAPALDIVNGGALDFPSGGVHNLNATGGPALNVTGTTSNPAITLDSVSSTNSPSDGINLDGLGTGTFSASSGDIKGAAGISVDIAGGNGTITYAGGIGDVGVGTNDGNGEALQVTGRTGGTVTLSGSIEDDNDAGGGVDVNSNSAGITALTGATKQFNTGASDAISFTGDSHTLQFLNGGLDIDTTSGNGLVATTAGTLLVGGTGNTIDSTALGASNRGLHISDTDIAAADVTFQRISTSGGISGVRLNNTGTAGNLAITGTGADHSGGTISNTSADAVSLTNTDNFIADEMNIQNPARDGFSGFGVTNFTVTDSTVHNAGQSDTDTLDSAFAFNTQASANENNIDGDVTITGNTITSPYGSGVAIFNHNGTISDLNVSSNTMTSGTIVAPGPGPASDNDSAGDGIQVVTFGGSGFAANLTKATVQNNNITGFPDGTGIEFLGGSQGTTTGVMGTPGNATNRVLIQGNDVDGHSLANPMLSGMIVFDVEGRARGNATIQNNGTAGDPMSNVAGNPIAVGGAGDGDGTLGPGDGIGVDLELHVLNNFLNIGDTPLSAGASGIGLGTDKDTIVGPTELADFDVNAEIANNSVLTPDGTGIRVLHRDHFGHLNVKVKGNTVGASNNGGNSGIRVENGSSGDAAYGATMCAEIGGTTAPEQNTTTASGPDGFGDVRPGITLVERDADPQYVFSIHQLSPSPANQEQAEAFVEGRNPASNLGTGVWAGERVAADNGTNWHACTMPAF